MYKLDYRPPEHWSNKMETIVQNNLEFVEKLENTNEFNTSNSVWRGAVSGITLFKGDREAAIRAGAVDQPNWNYTRKIVLETYGISRPQAEFIGNVNYAATGYVQYVTRYIELGFNESEADRLARTIIRFGGGVFQIWRDLKNNRFMNPDIHRTFYGEEIKDVPVIELGMDIGQSWRLNRLAEKSGVKLGEKVFGLSSEFVPVIRLIDSQLSKELRVQELKHDAEERIRRWEREAKEKRMNQEAEERSLRHEAEERELIQSLHPLPWEF